MSSLLHSEQSNPEEAKTLQKRIIIFSSTGGGGHTCAADAIKKYLDQEQTQNYTIKIVNLIDEVLGPIDPFKKCSFGYTSCEEFYNFCLQKNWPRTANNLYHIHAYIQPYLEKIFDSFVEKYLLTEQPHMVISVIPLVNGCLKRITQKLLLPFIIVPTDLDASLFMNGLHGPFDQSFKLCLSYNYEKIQNTCSKALINNQQIDFGGFPIRPDFFEPKNKNQIKKDFSIPENKPIVLLLMGAAGSDKIITYVQTLQKLTIPTHIIICLGRLESLRAYLSSIEFPKHISVTIVSHTNRISDLMAIADVAIIKPGSVSVNETLYMNLPTIIDNIGTPLLWEKFNVDFIEQNKFGSILKRFQDLANTITPYIADKKFEAEIRTNIASFSKKQFGPHIKNLVHSMLENTMHQVPNHEYHIEQKKHTEVSNNNL